MSMSREEFLAAVAAEIQKLTHERCEGCIADQGNQLAHACMTYGWNRLVRELTAPALRRLCPGERGEVDDELLVFVEETLMTEEGEEDVDEIPFFWGLCRDPEDEERLTRLSAATSPVVAAAASSPGTSPPLFSSSDDDSNMEDSIFDSDDFDLPSPASSPSHHVVFWSPPASPPSPSLPFFSDAPPFSHFEAVAPISPFPQTEQIETEQQQQYQDPSESDLELEQELANALFSEWSPESAFLIEEEVEAMIAADDAMLDAMLANWEADEDREPEEALSSGDWDPELAFLVDMEGEEMVPADILENLFADLEEEERRRRCWEPEE